MNALVSAETLKLRTARTFYALALGALGLIAIAIAASAGATSFHSSDHPGRDLMSIAGLAETFALLVGVLAVTTDFRYGTITPALLVTPNRTQLLVAKAIALLRAGFVFGLLAFGVAAAIALPILSSRGVATRLDGGDVAQLIAGGAAATALFAVIGVALGAVIRNQVGAIVTSLAMAYVVEPLLGFIPGVGNTIQKFGLGGLSSGAIGATGVHKDVELLGQVPDLLVLAAYAAVLLIAGAVILRSRDVTS